MRTIALEEHYATPAFMDGPGRQIKEEARAASAHPRVAAGLARLVEQLCDIGEIRVAGMDAAGIDVQVLSLTAPGIEQLGPAEAVAFARDTNDTLAEAVRRHPDRFAGLAALPTAAPKPPPTSCGAPSPSTASAAPSSTATAAAATWTTASSGRSWPVPRSCRSRSTSTRHHRRRRWSRRCTPGTTRPRSKGCWPPRPGAGTSTPPSTCCGSSSAAPWTGTRGCSW